MMLVLVKLKSLAYQLQVLGNLIWNNQISKKFTSYCVLFYFDKCLEVPLERKLEDSGKNVN